MKKNRLKKLRYGGTAIVITVLVLCAAVILNVICAMLAARYEWMYVNMTLRSSEQRSQPCFRRIFFSREPSRRISAGETPMLPMRR